MLKNYIQMFLSMCVFQMAASSGGSADDAAAKAQKEAEKAARAEAEARIAAEREAAFRKEAEEKAKAEYAEKEAKLKREYEEQLRKAGASTSTPGAQTAAANLTVMQRIKNGLGKAGEYAIEFGGTAVVIAAGGALVGWSFTKGQKVANGEPIWNRGNNGGGNQQGAQEGNQNAAGNRGGGRGR